MNSTVCPYCKRKFYDSSTKNRHIKIIHSSIAVLETKKRKGRIFCPKCPDNNKQTILSYALLMKHITDVHNIVIKQEKLKFANLEDFENWRALEDREVNYIKQNMVPTSNGKITYYNCNRSNLLGYQSNCLKRARKSEGSIKINGVCPSRIIVYRKNKGKVEVDFFQTHVGHNIDIRSQRLTNAQQEKIVEKLKNGVSEDKIILEAQQCKENEEFNRYNLLNKQDLRNLARKYNIKQRRDPDDMVALMVKVEEWNSNEKNSAFLFKKIGEPHPKLERKDFALGFMNKSMETRLKDYSRIICIEEMHRTSKKKFHLTIIMVKDNQDASFPVAFLLSNRQDQAVQEVFLEALKERIGEEIKAEFLMTDDDIKYHNAWVKIMGNTPRRLLSAWHITRNWSLQGRTKIKNANLKESMITDLEKLMRETNEENFFNLKNIYFKKLEYQNETSFINYLNRFYFNDDRIKMWAYCHQLDVGININMALESFNSKIKTMLERNPQATMKKLLDTIDAAVEGKIWNTIVNKYRPTANNTTSRKISKAHKVAAGCNVTEYVKVEEFGKFKVKSSTGERFYSVLYDNAVCNCEGKRCTMCSICMHTYKCECLEYAVKNIICKHAHMVSLYERKVAVGSVSSVSSEENQETESLLCIEEPPEEELILNERKVAVGSVSSVSSEENQETESLLCIEEPPEEELILNEPINEFKEEIHETLSDNSNQSLDVDIDKKAHKIILIESWKRTTINFLNQCYDLDDASFEKFEAYYNSHLIQLAQLLSTKRKMEKQAHFSPKRQRKE